MNPVQTKLPEILDQSPDCIFFKKPNSFEINEECVSNYATCSKIEILIEELKEKGPLVALGNYGPNAYVDKPFKLNAKMCNQDLYGWKPESKRKEYSKQSQIIILGAQKSNENEYIYFTMSDDITPNSTSYIRKHKPSNKDINIYKTSHKTFSLYLNDIYPPLKSSGLTKEQEYIQTLTSIMPLSSILADEEVRNKCNKIGQEIFDYFKNQYGNTSAGQNACVRICEAMIHEATDGKLRTRYIESAWDGIGDKNWRWMS